MSPPSPCPDAAGSLQEAIKAHVSAGPSSPRGSVTCSQGGRPSCSPAAPWDRVRCGGLSPARNLSQRGRAGTGHEHGSGRQSQPHGSTLRGPLGITCTHAGFQGKAEDNPLGAGSRTSRDRQSAGKAEGTLNRGTGLASLVSQQGHTPPPPSTQGGRSHDRSGRQARGQSNQVSVRKAITAETTCHQTPNDTGSPQSLGMRR